jgi:hypothetical protein
MHNKVLAKKGGAAGSNESFEIYSYICASIGLTVFKFPFLANTRTSAGIVNDTILLKEGSKRENLPIANCWWFKNG